MRSSQSVMEGFYIKHSHLLSINLDRTMNYKLPCLGGATGEQRTKDGGIKPSLQWCVHHLHVRRGQDSFRLFLKVGTGSTASSLLGTVFARQVKVSHRNNGGQTWTEHAFPLSLSNLLSVIGTSQSFGLPFLLKEGPALFDADFRQSRKVIEIVFVPRLPEFLSIISFERGSINTR